MQDTSARVANDENAVNVAAHEETFSIQLVTNNKYKRQVRMCGGLLSSNLSILISKCIVSLNFDGFL